MKKSNRQVGWAALVALSFVLVSAGCARERDLAVARVGDSVITLENLRASAVKIQRYQKFPDKEGLAKQRAYLDVLIDKTLMLKEARKQGFEKDSIVVAGTESFERALLLAKLRNREIVEKVTVTDQDIQDYYTTRHAGREVDVRRILVRTPEEAQAVSSELAAGKSFEEVGKAHSVFERLDAGSLRFDNQQAPAPIMEIVFGLPTGKTAGPIQTVNGYEFVEVTGEKHLELEEVRQGIASLLRSQREGELWGHLSREVLTRAHVEPNPEAFAVVVERCTRPGEDPPEFSEGERNMPLYKYRGGVLRLGEVSTPLARWSQREHPTIADTAAIRLFADDLLLRYRLLPREARRLKMDRLEDVTSRVGSRQEQLLTTQFYQREVADRVTVSDEEARQFYEAHKEQFERGATVEIRRVTFESRAGAMRARKLLEAGTDPEMLSAATREYVESDLGRYVLADSAFAAQEGDIVGPLETRDGYVVFKVVKRVERSYLPFEAAKERAVSSVRDQKQALLFGEFMTGLREKYRSQTIVYDGVLQLSVADQAPDAGPVD